MKFVYKFSFLILIVMLFSCSKDSTVDAQEIIEKPVAIYSVEVASISAPSLKSSKVANDTIQKAKVLLPPYYTSYPNQKYPVVYFIHGYDDDYRSDYGIFRAAYDEMLAERVKPFILVSVNCDNILGGTFGVNSPVTGNWEIHISEEVINYIDANYNTLAQKESRGIVGFSMGGFVALNLGLKHPDVYNLIYAMSPGVLTDADFKGAYDLWKSDGSFINAYGAAFSPNTALAYPHAGKPLFNKTASDSTIIANWKDGFGNFDRKVGNYLSGNERVKLIALDYGSSDYYAWIPRGCAYLAEVLETGGVPYEVHIRTNGYHEVNITQVKTYLLPFFSANLLFE